VHSTGLARVGAMGVNAAAKVRRAAFSWELVGAAAMSLAVVLPLGAPDAAFARGPQIELPAVPIGNLPPEAQTTYQLIFAGGPFPYQKDGTVFLNRERLLPQQARGFYREYTVKTPRSRDRGARRIICGGQPPTAPQACYYTADHYASFSRITAP
jgi:ribonuclease T1